MGEYTLDDLVEERDAGKAAQEAKSTGEWVTDLVDKLDDKGLLKPLMFGPDGGRGPDELRGDQGGAPAAPLPMDDADESAGSSRSQTAEQPDLDAERVKGIMLKVYDSTSYVPGLDDDPKLSDLIKLVDAQPDVVNSLIQQEMDA